MIKRCLVLLAMFALYAASGLAQIGTYGGPSVLSRGVGDTGERSGKPVNLRFYAEVNGIYDTGLTPLSVDSKGNLIQVNGLYGAEAAIGVYGTHNWRTTTLGLDYNGDYRYYEQNQYFNGSDHALTLGIMHQFSRRTGIQLTEVAGTASRALGGYYLGNAFADPLGVNNLLLFDNRAYYLQSGMDLILQKTARLSFSMGGDGYTVKRQSSALVGVNGYTLRGVTSYRWSRRVTLNGTYDYTHYDFPRAFGESNIHTFTGGYSVQVSRHWELGLQGGAFRLEAEGLQRTSVDPAISAITGQPSVIQAFYSVTTLPTYEARLAGRFKHSGVSMSYSSTLMPGNGVYLTSRTDNGGLSYSYTGLRKWNFGISGGYSRMQSVGLALGSYAGFNGGVGATYTLLRSLHLTSRYDVRHTEIDAVNFLRTSYRVTFGVAFSPGEVPLSLW